MKNSMVQINKELVPKPRMLELLHLEDEDSVAAMPLPQKTVLGQAQNCFNRPFS
ncbi:hypothetical protein LEP1GSC133_3856 [Leptospira borgpetersenii serovar Pomona str. 200901868]|uniref:Uncharacterized protein n=1 Tax=Leptospira borgpetersenii serovar Pomona str. 200901868 TaxID=1192866 RepID=M6WRS6_LEPBO|nr:hypothetical protein LEP1GSC133_3856 [Leptospira borgpetersenii serovar Pomona str. 200901868]